MPVGDTGQMATETAQHQATRRPGGRSARVRAAVHRAVQELLAEDTGDQLTIPAVAARAGVHPTTVYRRWGSVGELLTDVATSRFSGVLVVPDSGNLREDLERYAADVAKDLSDPDSLALVRAAVGAGGENVDVCQAERQEQLQAILERGRARAATMRSPPSNAPWTDSSRPSTTGPCSPHGRRPRNGPVPWWPTCSRSEPRRRRTPPAEAVANPLEAPRAEFVVQSSTWPRTDACAQDPARNPSTPSSSRSRPRCGRSR